MNKKFKHNDIVLFAPDLKGARWQKGVIVGDNFDDNEEVKIYYIKNDDLGTCGIIADERWIFPYEDYMEYYINKKVRSNDPRIIPIKKINKITL